MTDTKVDTIKDQIRSHTIEPFNIAELNVDQDSYANSTLRVSDRFNITSSNIPKLLSSVGIRENLRRKSFADPELKWASLRQALSNVNHADNLAAIVNSDGNTIDILNTGDRTRRELDYDDRIDSVIDGIDSTDHELHSINWNGGDVSITTRDALNEVDCGGNDIWQTGVDITLGHNKQEFSSFYLRLICANGMTTQEKYARRQCSSRNINNQLTRFIQQNDFTGLLNHKVSRLKNHYASVYEATSIAEALSSDEQQLHTPWLSELRETYINAGRPIGKMSAAQKKLAYTNENLYDVFNQGTSLATHNASELGEGKCMRINRTCADIFAKGPNLQLKTLNPYATTQN